MVTVITPFLVIVLVVALVLLINKTKIGMAMRAVSKDFETSQLMGIKINNAARMIQMIRRSPSDAWLGESWQKEMFKIEDCIECGACLPRCPYELNIPELLKKNLADYKDILAGKVKVRESEVL